MKGGGCAYGHSSEGTRPLPHFSELQSIYCHSAESLSDISVNQCTAGGKRIQDSMDSWVQLSMVLFITWCCHHQPGHLYGWATGQDFVKDALKLSQALIKSLTPIVPCFPRCSQQHPEPQQPTNGLHPLHHHTVCPEHSSQAF